MLFVSSSTAAHIKIVLSETRSLFLELCLYLLRIDPSTLIVTRNQGNVTKMKDNATIKAKRHICKNYVRVNQMMPHFSDNFFIFIVKTMNAFSSNSDTH